VKGKGERGERWFCDDLFRVEVWNLGGLLLEFTCERRNQFNFEILAEEFGGFLLVRKI
jgi:hypothetical protein